MDDPPESLNLLIGMPLWSDSLSWSLLLGIMMLIGLLACSALISGAEVAFFSLTAAQVNELKDAKQGYRKLVDELLQRPKRLLATILVVNSFVNIGIVILSTYLIGQHIPQETLNYLIGGLIPIGRLIEIAGITLLVLLFGEIMPKIYANQNAVGFSVFMSYPLYYLSRLFGFISVPLIKLSGLIDKRAAVRSSTISVDELGRALELTEDGTFKEKDDREILEGIVKFGSTDVKQIMQPRTDIEAIEKSTPYKVLLGHILESGFSRIPIYENSLDNMIGIIHIKDLLPHMDEADGFDWPSLMREPFFVPESKMIDDLLEEFREKKVHMAIVVDEYGGCEGLVTLEDIIEEIVGDISDEFDNEDLVYSKLDELNFIFEGKTTLREFYRATKIEDTEFEDHKGESDTLAGFILELVGIMPTKNQKVTFSDFEFTIESVDKRRIIRIKASRKPMDEKDISPKGGANLKALLLLISIGLVSCGQDFTPKPNGYMRIDLPKESYAPIHTDCPFTFEIATYSTFDTDVANAEQPCYFNIDYPQFKAKFHFSYKQVENNLPELLEESRTLANRHITKAAAIDETLILKKDTKVYGMLYTIEGSRAASPLQLYLTDSTDHFLRGALYFRVSPNNDSLAPVIGLLKDDLLHLIGTLRWKR